MYGGKGHSYTDSKRAIDKGKRQTLWKKSDGKTFYGCDYRSAPCGTMADWKDSDNNWKDSDDNWKDSNVERQNMDYKAGNSSA